MTRKKTILFSMLTVILLVLLSGCLHSGASWEYQRALEKQDTDISAALQILTNLVEKYPNDPNIPQIQYRIGRIHLSQNNPETAIQHFQWILDHTPESPWAISADIEISGLTQNEADDSFIQHLENLKKSLEDKQLASRADFYLGKFYLKQNRFARALKYFKNATAFRTQEGDNYYYWLKIGLCEFNLADLAVAEQHLKKALSLNINHDPEVYLVLSDYYRAIDQKMTAIKILFSGINQETDTKLIHKIQTDLSSDFSNEDLESLSTQFISGLPYYLLERELINRSIETGELDEAKFIIDKLTYQYPEFSTDLSNLSDSIKNFTAVNRERIGLIIPLSGALSGLGQSVYRGVSLAISKFRDQNPLHLIECVIRDSGGTPEGAKTGFLDLVENKKVFAIIGPLKSVTTREISALSEEYHIPVITPGCPNNDVCKTSSYLFRMYPSASREGFRITQFLIDQTDFQRFACVYPDMPYGRLAFEGFKTALERAQRKIVFSASYPPSMLTFSNVLEQLKEADPEIIFVPDTAERAAQVAGQIRYQEILDPPFFGTGSWEDKLIMKIGGPHLNEAVFASEYPISCGPRTEIALEYQAQYGEIPDPFALRAYEATKIILDSLASETRYREQFQKILRDQNGVQGIDGKCFFSQEGHYLPVITIFKISKGQIIPFARWEDNSLFFMTDEVLYESLLEESDETSIQEKFPSPNDRQLVNPALVLE